MIKILFFGATADAAGTREITSQFLGGEDVGSLLERLAKEYPRLADHHLLVSVNEQYVEPETYLVEGDEVAIFTAVSGG